MQTSQMAINETKPGWLQRHAQKVREVNNRSDEIQVVFMGDSITQAWEDRGKREWQQYFAHRGALNLGFGGDCTEHLLWRIVHGELERLAPKLIVLLIGTNNTGHRQDPPQYTADSITTIVDTLHRLMPNTQVLLHALLPRGETPQDPLRMINQQINQLIQPLAQRHYVSWLDLTDLFTDEQGLIKPSVMKDYLHPNVYQYKRWAGALEPKIRQLMGD